MKIEKKIDELGIKLPPSSPPGAMYVPVKQLGNALFVAGQVPFVNGELAYRGAVGDKVTLEEAEEAARICIINMGGIQIERVIATKLGSDCRKYTAPVNGFLAHAHLVGSGDSETWVIEPREALLLRAVSDVRELLQSGFTGVRDMES